MRAKLHNAVRKGKTIDAERAKKASEAEALAARVAELECAISAAKAAGAPDSSVAPEATERELDSLRQDNHALEQQLRELAAREQESAAMAAALEGRLQQEAAAQTAKREAEANAAQEAAAQAAAREALLQATLAEAKQENAELRWAAAYLPMHMPHLLNVMHAPMSCMHPS